MMNASYSRASLAQLFCLLARNIDGAFARELHMVQVQHFVVEGLQSALGNGDQAHREIQAGQPAGGLHQVLQMVEIDLMSLRRRIPRTVGISPTAV